MGCRCAVTKTAHDRLTSSFGCAKLGKLKQRRARRKTRRRRIFGIMKATIKVIKQKAAEDAVTTNTETSKPVAPSTAGIVSTIKHWIAESKERKQNQRRSFPILMLVLMITFVLVALGTPVRNHQQDGPARGRVHRLEGPGPADDLVHRQGPTRRPLHSASGRPMDRRVGAQFEVQATGPGLRLL